MLDLVPELAEEHTAIPGAGFPLQASASPGPTSHHSLA